MIGRGTGYLAQNATSGGEGIEYIVHMDDGRTVTLVQNRASGEMPISNGTPVLVQLGGSNYSRVVVDPRGAARTSPAGVAAGPTQTSWAVRGRPARQADLRHRVRIRLPVLRPPVATRVSSFKSARRLDQFAKTSQR
ncbi:MAG: hypothetical protein IPK78_13440 [Rhodospirillales bacterium]|nr:hypothetical protein [Rhodospirillales bacterium]